MPHIHAINLDPRTGTAYIQFEPPAPGTSARQVNIGDALIFDLGADGRLVGIEILDPALVGQFARPESARALDQARIPVHLTP